MRLLEHSGGVKLGSDSVQRYDIASRREWLVTNGIGGFAAGSVAGVLTRRYHGLLFAALAPPVRRTLLLAKLDASVTYGGVAYALSTNHWGDGSVSPAGYEHLSSFELDGNVPRWTYAIGDAILERTIWMRRHRNETYIRYTLRAASQPMQLALDAFIADRDYHALSQPWQLAAPPVHVHGTTARVQMGPRGNIWYLGVDRGRLSPVDQWWYSYALTREAERGLDSIEVLYRALNVQVELQPGESVTVIATTDPIEALAGDPSLDLVHHRFEQLHLAYEATHPNGYIDRDLERQLVLAAGQFIVRRTTPWLGRGHSIIAGYPWFADWGRDAMIALPGLTLVTGRYDIARSILRTITTYLRHGLVPNRFPDDDGPPEYNTADATLWCVEALRLYYERTDDKAFLEEVFPTLRLIVDWHVAGTIYNIHMDQADGLLYAGDLTTQVTWMDAKVGNLVVTPRAGKPVEINALWINALITIAGFAKVLGIPYQEFADRAAFALVHFERFWNGSRGYAYDVIDGPQGDDGAVRPNAVIAVALGTKVFTDERERMIVDRAQDALLTPYGLRTLAPDEPGYHGHYGGTQLERDRCYHQGAVWPWLMGPFVRAHLRVHRDVERAKALLVPFRDLLMADAIGTLPEVCDGDAPHAPNGCFAQAWSVGEILRAFDEIGRFA